MKTSRKINLKDSLLLMIGLISLNGFCLAVNSQTPPASIPKPQLEKRGYVPSQPIVEAAQSGWASFDVDGNNGKNKINEISILDQILLGCLPILIGMGSMALFTFLLTFLNQYSINRLINLQKSIQAGSLEKKSYPKT